jgi:hypothetical protein
MAETYKLEIEQRSTFTQTVEYLDSQNQPVDLTGYSAAMQIRRTVESADALLSLTDDSGGGLIITPLLGKIEINIDAADTSSLPAGSFVYDLIISSASVSDRILQGRCIVSPAVTR